MKTLAKHFVLAVGP